MSTVLENKLSQMSISEMLKLLELLPEYIPTIKRIQVNPLSEETIYVDLITDNERIYDYEKNEFLRNHPLLVGDDDISDDESIFTFKIPKNISEISNSFDKSNVHKVLFDTLQELHQISSDANESHETIAEIAKEAIEYVNKIRREN